MTFGVYAGGECFIDLYEAPAITAVGTALPVYCMKRFGGQNPLPTVFYDPTVAGGLLIFNGMGPAGSGPQAGGSAIRNDTEWILRGSTDYYFVLTNDSGATHDFAIAIEFYEHGQ